MSVAVYVWNTSLIPWNVGHAAMRVRSAGVSFDLSWHPSSDSIGNVAARKQKIRDGLWSLGMSKDLDAELRARPADHTIELHGLDEASMERWLRAEAPRHYAVGERNCARMVADGLVAGGAHQVIGNPLRRWHVLGQHRWWWPYEIKRLARAMERELVQEPIGAQTS